MKKFILLFSLLIFGVSVIADDAFSLGYANKLFHCLPDTHSFKLGNEDYQTHSSGWKDSKCRFAITVTDKKNNITNYNCKLSREQVNALNSAIKTDLQGTGESKKLFEKFRNDKETCKIKN